VVNYRDPLIDVTEFMLQSVSAISCNISYPIPASLIFSTPWRRGDEINKAQTTQPVLSHNRAEKGLTNTSFDIPDIEKKKRGHYEAATKIWRENNEGGRGGRYFTNCLSMPSRFG